MAEKVMTHHHDLDFDLLTRYLARSPHIVRKLFDSILDKTDITNKSFPQPVEAKAWTLDTNNKHDEVEIAARSGFSNEGAPKV